MKAFTGKLMKILVAVHEYLCWPRPRDLSSCDRLMVFPRIVRSTERSYEGNSQAGYRQHDRYGNPCFRIENTQNNITTTRGIGGSTQGHPRRDGPRIIRSLGWEKQKLFNLFAFLEDGKTYPKSSWKTPSLMTLLDPGV